MTKSGSTLEGSAFGARAAVSSAAVLFGTSAVAVGMFAPGLDASTTAGWRIVLGGLALVVVTMARGQAPWRYRFRGRPILFGATAFLVFQLGFFAAVDRSGVATATVVTIGTGPIAAGILDRWQHGVILRHRWWLGIGTAIGGIAVLCGARGVDVDPVGLLLAVAAGCSFPVFGSVIRELSIDRPALTAVATVFGVAGLPGLILLAAAGSDPFASFGVTAVLLFLGLVTTTAAYVLWVRGLAVLSLSDTVTLTMLEPIAATVLAVLILNEPAGFTTVVGVVAAMVGVWIATTSSTGLVSKARAR